MKLIILKAMFKFSFSSQNRSAQNNVLMLGILLENREQVPSHFAKKILEIEEYKQVSFISITDASRMKLFTYHCVKSVQMRTFFRPYFPIIGLNTERYGVNTDQKKLCIWTLFTQRSLKYIRKISEDFLAVQLAFSRNST